MTSETGKKKRTWLAVLLSLLLPGLGQIYIGTFGKGLALMGANFLISLLNRDFVRQFMEEKRIDDNNMPVFAAYLVAGFAVTALAVIDAKVSANRANTTVQREEE